MAKARFTQADVMRALAPAIKLGLPVTSYTIDAKGGINVQTAEETENKPDAALANWERKHGTD